MMNFIKTLEIEFENYCKDALVQATKGIQYFSQELTQKFTKQFEKKDIVFQ